MYMQASIFHYGSISLIENPCRSTHLTALKFAKSFGCLLSYDPNLRLALWPSSDAAKENIMSIWDQSDIIKVLDNQLCDRHSHVMPTEHSGCRIVSHDKQFNLLFTGK